MEIKPGTNYGLSTLHVTNDMTKFTISEKVLYHVKILEKHYLSFNGSCTSKRYVKVSINFWLYNNITQAVCLIKSQSECFWEFYIQDKTAVLYPIPCASIVMIKIYSHHIWKSHSLCWRYNLKGSLLHGR